MSTIPESDRVGEGMNIPLQWGFLLPLGLPPLVVWSVTVGGVWSFAAVAVVFGLVPVLDLLLGRDTRNPASDAESAELESRFYYRAILYAWVPLQLGLLAWAVWQAGQGLDALSFAGLLLSVGVVTGGIGITVAHELGHKRSEHERFLARLLLITVAYLQFYVEHNRGHHARVATPEDPATARLGESFFCFLPRTVIGGTRSAWHFECERMEKLGLPRYHPRNQMLWAVAGPLVLIAAAGWFAGPAGILLFAGQAAVAVILLELVNYIEHYGLERRAREGGGYEKVTIHHSWNASQRLTNWFLFNLQRHSHHHAHALTRYQALRHFDESPQLPAGYAGMVLLALVPPLWRRIMDPRAECYRREVLGIE